MTFWVKLLLSKLIQILFDQLVCKLADQKMLKIVKKAKKHHVLGPSVATFHIYFYL